ncbi:MAG TPA: hypothetical protein VD704_05840, partial [Gaiellaceae bacterium]|nr:hypothetical protein [Gaiellaceae bacterium]
MDQVLSSAGPRVDDWIAANEGSLVELVRSLVRFDTTSVDLSPGSVRAENEEEALQLFVGERLG